MRASTDRRYSLIARRGFTLVELMVTLTIIAVLIAILIPIVSKVRRTAAVSRTKRDLETIRVALDAYKSVWQMYPQVTPNTFPAGVSANNIDGVAMYTDNGAHALYTALALRGQVRVSRTTDVNSKAIVGGSAPYGPFVNVEQMRTAVDKSVPGPPNPIPILFLCDANGHPILYIPASRIPVSYTVTATVPAAPGFYVADSSTSGAGKQIMYDYHVMPLIPDPNDSTVPNIQPFKNGVSDMQKLIGDTNANGVIDATGTTPEQAAYTGPYLLWTAGADGLFGINASGKSDDITNFEISAPFREN